jgi:hypothetical protein
MLRHTNSTAGHSLPLACVSSLHHFSSFPMSGPVKRIRFSPQPLAAALGGRASSSLSLSPVGSSTPKSTEAEADDFVAGVAAAVRRTLESVSSGSLSVSELYARLPDDLRRQLRGTKMSLSGCLARFAAGSFPSEKRQLYLHDNGLTVSLHAAATPAVTTSPAPSFHVKSVRLPEPPKTIRVPQQGVDVCKRHYGDDFCFHVKLTEIPEPPARPLASAPDSTSSESIFSVGSFVPIIPTYFVPLDEVLALLPGYSAEHIRQYLGCSKTVQIVSIEGEGQFLRVHGGYGQLDLTGTEEAEAQFSQYEPREELAAPFIAAFDGVRERWMPLQTLLQRAGAEAERALPYQGRRALLYFAQLQHIFSFAPDDGGAVMLRRPFFTGLGVESSPTPKAVARALAILPLHDQVDYKVFLDQLPDDAKLDIAKKFPSLEHFLRSHGELFYLSEDNLVVMRARHKKLLDTRALPLAEQLEIALKDRNKKRIRSIRRQMALSENADHPLLNPENLAKEVFNYVPKKGHIPVKQLFKRVLPVELLNFMPQSFGKFFKNYPQYFQLYEFGTSTNWVVSRSGTPIPPGAIRKEFTEDDCVSILAELLQARGAKSVSFLSLHLPDGVREYIKKFHGSMITFALRHKEYFALVHTIDSGNNKESACVINLIQMPLRREDTSGGADGLIDGEDDDEESGGEEDEPSVKNRHMA